MSRARRDAERRGDAARLPPDDEEVAALAELIGPRPYTKHVLAGRPEAERQLELGPKGAVAWLASRS